jgi:tetratricopeptide (TPR) repeat protein
MKAPPPVEVRRKKVILPTYEPQRPDRNPMFLEKRVYQGSSGRVYPLPFTDRIAEDPQPRAWEAVFIENEYLRVMILPALGGRIHRVQDKTNGYDLIYHQTVIKPALVGLAGPWASGGIEFNWPQHHRPSTFMPADVCVERHGDGAMTVWLGEHDPMARMKGMHGVRLHPGRSLLEVVARAYNRTADVQSFLWWANVGIEAHEHYQSFFPPDVTHVADHAKRAISTFPLCEGSYYGIDYAGRARRGVPVGEKPRQFAPAPLRNGSPGPAQPAANDLSWYANIPVPTSYMCLGSGEDFAGGYDHRAKAGIVQVSNHHICPGKKQWTWGNQEFGYAWDRNLTDPDRRGVYRPYIELMAGSFTDNQPDFSFLQPGETKTWSQFWYPIRAIGPAQKANTDAAVSFRVDRGIAHVGVCVTGRYPDARITLVQGGKPIGDWSHVLSPEKPLVFEAFVDAKGRPEDLKLTVYGGDGAVLIAFAPSPRAPGAAPAPATEPAEPPQVGTNDELFMIGLHLEQYRHATRTPEPYWREALRRDPGDARCNLALGRWHLRRGELDNAERHLRASIARLVERNPNPYDGEPYYQLGLCLRAGAAAGEPGRARMDEAYGAFFKATWNHAWQPAGFHALAEIDAQRGDWPEALDHIERALRVNSENLRARDLWAIILQRLGRAAEASEVLRATLALDPLDWWARHLSGAKLTCDNQVRLDLALDYARAGLFREALGVLAEAPAGPPVRQGRIAAADLPDGSIGTAPLLHYYRAWLCHCLGDDREERQQLALAAKAPLDYCFPARLEEIAILGHAIARSPTDAHAPFLLGNLLYDRRRHAEGIAMWRRAVKLDPKNPVAWRNLGIGSFNVLRRPAAARAAYERAFALDSGDARILYERDQLWKRLGVAPAARLRQLERHAVLVRSRDDLSVELCDLYNQTGSPERALGIVSTRRFQPWEGGEGLALRQHVRTHLALGRRALAGGEAPKAVEHFRSALSAPENLGEANHLLANQSDIHFWLGRALGEAGDTKGSREHLGRAARFRGDFQAMSVRPVSEMTYYSALALRSLGEKAQANKLLREVLGHARQLAREPAKLDYFATSLPTMLLFEDDLRERQATAAMFLSAQAKLGLGLGAEGRKLLREVLRRDPSHAFAADQPS